jgi:hypothetical protein
VKNQYSITPFPLGLRGRVGERVRFIRGRVGERVRFIRGRVGERVRFIREGSGMGSI